ncbi:amino acid ABC transporter permease/ATP-binding protein [Salinicola avicenniae]|uniref:amino acid ABC transporter permease/ATP-binding protein n=1 Tax=Salinicola avicenniae TaxID=2916836 RepID=UPI0020740F3C|nr:MULTISPECIES: amino acid ABC transporter permease/ATP-binding protein [unclassified Salinicola]
MQDFLHYLTLPYLWQGGLIAVELLIGALTGGVVIGFFLALASLSKQWWIRLPVQTYIYILRGTPVLLQLILLYNVLPQFGVEFSAFYSALIALTINETAFCAEIIRGGIQATDREQRMAAQAFGFSRTTEMVRVVIPQALRAILPTLGNEAVGLLKSTSLASVVGVNELTMRGQTIVSQNFLFIPVLVASGAIYIALSSGLAGIQWWLESHVGLEHRARRARRRYQRLKAKMTRSDGTALVATPESRKSRVLEIDDLHVAYGDSEVLKGISLTVKRGEVVVMLGRSGSGKSTLLKSILALAPVTAGSIQVDGHRMGQTRGGRPLRAGQLADNRARSGVGIVFQHFALFDHMTALQNAMSIPRLVQRLPTGVACERASRALEHVELGAFEASMPHELSGGQKQRVGIARALASHPKVLLFDEPTSALDPELVREVNQTIRGLAHTGITMLITTHDIAFAESVADRIVFLKDGHLVEQGPPSILQTPRTEALATFLRHEEATHLKTMEVMS